LIKPDICFYVTVWIRNEERTNQRANTGRATTINIERAEKENKILC